MKDKSPCKEDCGFAFQRRNEAAQPSLRGVPRQRDSLRGSSVEHRNDVEEIRVALTRRPPGKMARIKRKSGKASPCFLSVNTLLTPVILLSRAQFRRRVATKQGVLRHRGRDDVAVCPQRRRRELQRRAWGKHDRDRGLGKGLPKLFYYMFLLHGGLLSSVPCCFTTWWFAMSFRVPGPGR